MSLPSTNRARASLNRRIRRSPFRRGRSRRGVSDVVATILILALTVTLFASIFAFVGSFPSPPPQNVNQFQASLVRTTNQSYISGLKINHLTGPLVPGSDHIYLESATHEPNWQFSISGGIPIYWGLSPNASTSSWSFGQYWSTTFTKLIKVPDNITVYVLTPNQLLYSAVLPGLVISTPPAILSSGIVPSTLSVGEGFEVYASLGGTLTGLIAKVNLAAIPGLSGNVSLTLQANGFYTYTSASGPTSSGTWYALVYVTNTLGQVASTTVAVVVAGANTGSNGLSVNVFMSVQPPTVPQQGTAAYFWATVTYTGSKTGLVYLNFTIDQLAGGRKVASSLKTTIPGTGSTPLSITGPSSLTIYSQTTYNFNSLPAYLNSSLLVNAPTTVTGVGQTNGSIAFSTQNLVHSAIYITTNSAGALANKEITFSHNCGAACPYLYVTVWDNFSVALGGPATVTVAGLSWENSSVHNYELPAAGIASTTVTAGTELFINLNGGVVRWSGMLAGSYILHVWFVVKSTAAGTPILGYVSDGFKVTIT
ncbi:MAG: type IV pilin N-terminal domain-containing protein [Thermoplasmata archaeon]